MGARQMTEKEIAIATISWARLVGLRGARRGGGALVAGSATDCTAAAQTCAQVDVGAQIYKGGIKL